MKLGKGGNGFSFPCRNLVRFLSLQMRLNPILLHFLLSLMRAIYFQFAVQRILTALIARVGRLTGLLFINGDLPSCIFAEILLRFLYGPLGFQEFGQNKGNDLLWLYSIPSVPKLTRFHIKVDVYWSSKSHQSTDAQIAHDTASTNFTTQLDNMVTEKIIKATILQIL